MAGKYSDCYFCGGAVEEQRTTREVWWHGKLHLIENVPVGVCRQCGEKVILPPIAKAIDCLLAGDMAPDAFVQVPRYHFREAESAA
jgi:YgiT-type zinc finger domain-containing protein